MAKSWESWTMRRAADDAPNAFRFYRPLRPQIALPDETQIAALKEKQSS
jgi:hypothetical protein